MARYDLKTDEGLERASKELQQSRGGEDWYEEWIEGLARDFEWIRNANEATRRQLAFQQRLWEENHVSSVGQGNVSVELALQDESFRAWLAQRSMQPLPDSPERRLDHLAKLYDQIIERLKPFCNRNPHLKVFRVLVALYPGELTTICYRRSLRRLHFAMGGLRGVSPMARHAYVLDRLRKVLGEAGSDLRDLARRVALPWLLYADAVEGDDEEATTEPTTKPGEEKLLPLPAARRRRGLTPIRGGFPSALAVLEYVRDGVTREQLLDHLRTGNPALKDSSLGVIINTLQGELGVIRWDGNQYVLTERGAAVLESEDAGELADWLLTHILGVDHALVRLRDSGPTNTRELVRQIRSVNPGWTTEFVPRGILGWLRSFGVIDTGSEGVTSLTESGKEWAERIHWKPQGLPRDDEAIVEEKAEEPEAVEVRIPAFAEIHAKVANAGRFEQSLVAQLHAGIWAHKRRHFAILTGLSGSGKTLLAREYGKALLPEGTPVSQRLCTVAVQPGWYDPGALLGYVNPLRGDSYVRTPFLEFILRASQDPEHPYVAVLDEMNLSHPEQYMAPLLSAMETGSRVVFHSEGDVFDGIPPSIPYPPNFVLIGTVNMDETTHGLSDKVLDRAFTLEFWEIDLDHYPRWGTRGLSQADVARARAALKDLIVALAPARLHFGWRVVDDVLDFIALATRGSAPLPIDDALDHVVYAKVVPKLRGDDTPRFRDALEACCSALRQHRLDRSRLKVEELQRDLEATGSARFWR